MRFQLQYLTAKGIWEDWGIPYKSPTIAKQEAARYSAAQVKDWRVIKIEKTVTAQYRDGEEIK